MFGPCSDLIFQPDPYSGVVFPRVEVIVLRLHIGVVEGLMIGLLRVLPVSRGADVPAREARPAVHLVRIAESCSHRHVGVFLKSAVIAGVAAKSLVHFIA